MPKLLFENNSISFNAIGTADLKNMPQYAAEAAKLILEWNNGAGKFELKTSGSTGKPKPFEAERKHIIHSARLTAETFGLKKGDTLLCCLPLDKIAGFMMAMRALVNECNLVLSPPSANPLHEIDASVMIDFAAFVPLQVEAMLNRGYDNISRLNRMKALIIGGAGISENLRERIQIISAPVFHTYGMTETYTHVAIRRLNGPYASSSYSALEGVQLSLNYMGRLVIKSMVTEKKPLVTNDLVKFNEDGSFQFTGRADFVINSGGIKIQPEQVEDETMKLLNENGMASAQIIATGLPDALLGQKLVLVVESNEWPKEKVSKFLNLLDNAIEKYHTPKEIFFMDKFPLTSNGKIDRLSLQQKLLHNRV